MTGGEGDKKVGGMAGSEPDQAAGRRPPWWAAVAAVVLVVAVPVATWWLVGDQTDPELKRRLQAVGIEPSYTVPPLDIAPAAERAVGVVAVVLVVAAVVVLILAWLTGHLHVGWWGVLGVLSLVGAGWGFMWRGLTAADPPDCKLCGPAVVAFVAVIMGPIGLGLVWAALWGARRLIAPRQPPTTGGWSTTSQDRSPAE
jgi:uncharacterized membrane protein YkvA (DUF1232 family)